MRHNDDAFATMLLMSNISADKEELVKPLSSSEYVRLRDRIGESDLSGVGALLGMDVSGVRRTLELSEREAYRICVLVSRVMPFSYALERFMEAGIDIVTVDEPGYPQRLIERLDDKAPPMLYYCGELSLASWPGIAMVGEASRPGAAECAREISEQAGRAGITMIAGDEPGAGRLAEDMMFKTGGRHILCLAGAMSDRIYQPGISEMIAGNRALALSVVHPDTRYTISHALGRNKFLYALSNAAFIMSLPHERGALWNGVCSAMRCEWIRRVYVIDDPALPANKKLIDQGATAFTSSGDIDMDEVRHSWNSPEYSQTSLFDMGSI